MKRLGIFVFYDPQGIVDRYIEFLIDELETVIDRLIIVCNGKLNAKGKRKFNKYTNEIIMRDNIGYDGWAYRHAIMKYLGREETTKYDELLLLNDTFFGPFIPMNDIFQNMNKSDCDVWGLSMHPQFIQGNTYKNEHLQSYFILIRKRALNSQAFWDFWETMEKPYDFESAVDNFEIDFSGSMLQSGFRLESYARLDVFISKDVQKNYNYCSLNVGEMLREAGYPVIKRKQLVSNSPVNVSVEDACEYIESNTNYNMDLIWQNLLRRYNLEEIREGIGLYRQIGIDRKRRISLKNACIIFFVSDPTTLDDFDKYYDRIHDYIDIIIISNGCDKLIDQRKGKYYSFYKAEKNKNIFEFIAERFDIIEPYKYIGICLDTEDERKKHRHRKYLNHELRNRSLFGSIDIIRGVIHLLANDKLLALCYPMLWGNVYSEELYNKNLINTMRIICGDIDKEVILNEDYPLVLGAESFWCKKSVLKMVIDIFQKQCFDMEKVDCFIKMLPYYLQSKGFYINYVYNSECIPSLLRNSYDTIGQVSAVRSKENDAKIVNKVNKYCDCELYIYGCGIIGTKYARILKKNCIDFKAFVVSDGEVKEKRYMGKDVIYLSEYVNSPFNAIVVGVGKRLYREILTNLKNKKIKNVIQI